MIIPGAQKGGTTSFAHMLNMNKAVVLAQSKEPDFFCLKTEYIDSDSYKEEYINSHEGDPSRIKYIIDASTCYLPSETAPEKIRSSVRGEVKCCIILRNPLERMRSAYTYQREYDKRRAEDVFLFDSPDANSLFKFEEDSILNGFEKGLIRKKRTRLEDPIWYHRIIRNSFYFDDVCRYFDVFGEKNVHLVVFEHFVKNPTAHVNRLFDFLGVDPSSKIKNIRSNPTHTPRNNFTSSLLRTLSAHLNGKIKTFAPSGLVSLYRKISYRRDDFRLPRCFVERLTPMLCEDCARLSKISEYEFGNIWFS